MRTFKQDHFTRLFNNLYSLAHVGTSININSLRYAPKVGYMVSIKGVKVYEHIQDVITGEVISLVKELHDGSNKNYLGIWTDSVTGKCYIDISQWFDNKDKAIAKGIELHEIAIFDLSNCEEIRIKD